MKIKLVLLFLSILASLHSKPAYAQPSLAAENIIDDIRVTTKYNKQKIYTVFRDARNRDQWYYMPNELRVAEETGTNGKVKPKMTILRYQYIDPATQENKEGGVLVAAFTYAMEPEVVNLVKNQIKQKKGGANITLSAIPLNTSNIDFLSASDQFIGNVDAKTVGVSGATSASQEMVISYNLTTLGASVFKGLATSNGGIPIRANITYNGLSAPCGYTIKGNWDNVYKYFEENKLYEGRFNFWIISGGGSSSKNTVRESLNSIQGMTVNQVGCDSAGSTAGTANSDDANLQDLVKTFQKEVYSDAMMNRATELEKLLALLPKTSDPGVQEKIEKAIEAEKNEIRLGYQKSVKDIRKRRKGALNYNFSKQKLVLRQTSIGGLLSFSKYGLTGDQLVRDGYVIDIDANQDFPSVIIGLPNISPDFELRTVVLNIAYTNSAGQTHSEARQWDVTKNGWVTPTNAEVGYVRFNLLGENNKKKREEPEFDINLQIVSKIPNAGFTIRQKVKLSRGERYLDAIELLTKQFIVDGSGLDFSKTTNNPADLAYAKLIFKKGTLNINKDIKPFIRDGVAGPPNPVFLLLPKDDTPESGTITYYKADNGKKIERQEPLIPGENTLGNFEWKE